jgi:hypothetical protein
MNLQYGGRPVSWFGVSAPADVVSAGIATLRAAVARYGGAGINNFGGAVAGLQAAGNAAVSAVGPAIDALSGGDPQVMRATQLAWQQNARLASVNSSNAAVRADVDAAKAVVDQMVTLYEQAARLAASLAPKSARSAVPAALPPAVPDASPGGGLLDWLAENKTAVLAGGAVVLVGGAVLAAVASRRPARVG